MMKEIATDAMPTPDGTHNNYQKVISDHICPFGHGGRVKVPLNNGHTLARAWTGPLLVY